jgi:hypothetical protein
VWRTADPYHWHTSRASSTSRRSSAMGRAAAGDRATYAILHRVEVQIEFLGGCLIAAPAAKKHTQRVAQARVVLVVGRKLARHVGHPFAGLADLTAKQRCRGQTRSVAATTVGPCSPRTSATPPATLGESGRFGANWRTLSTASDAGARYGNHPHPQSRSAATNSGLAAASAARPTSRRMRCNRGSSSPSVPRSGYHMTNARWCHRSG